LPKDRGKKAFLKHPDQYTSESFREAEAGWVGCGCWFGKKIKLKL